MCGIVAIFSQNAPIEGAALERATKSLHHRGPDSERRWMSADKKVGLGHARLSIIDLTTGDQPIANEDETLHIVVNGELYEYEAIQKELEQKGHRLRTRSDSEIVLHLYEESGIQCLSRLRGEFAFALWDNVNRTMFAARDRFGIKPLFYALHDGVLYLASEVKALFAAGVPARWDAESVFNSFEFGGNQTRTLFAGIFQIPPGHYMLATENKVTLSKYWDFDYPKAAEASKPLSDEEYIEQFKHAFDEAVRIRLRADVPVGCYLSGGIDSCAILGFASRHHPQPIRAFTLTFDRPEYSEGQVAREMAAKAGAEFFPVPIRQDELADNFFDAMAQAEALCVNSHGVAKYLLSKAVRKAGYKVVLTGEGSDEMLGGYMHFRRDLKMNGASPGGQPPVRDQVRSLEGVRRLLGFVPGWMETSSAQSAKVYAVLTDEFVAKQAPLDGFGSFFGGIDVPGQLTGREPLHQSLYLWAKTRLPNYLLTLLGDRMEMGHSVEGRVPFLDHKLVEVIRSQPVTQKIRGMAHKYILRESVKGTVTDTVYRRPKQPFLSPPAMLDPRGRLSLLMQDTLRGPVLASIPFFDQKKVLGVLDGLQAMDESSRAANDHVLMTLLSACVLQERFRLSF